MSSIICTSSLTLSFFSSAMYLFISIAIVVAIGCSGALVYFSGLFQFVQADVENFTNIVFLTFHILENVGGVFSFLCDFLLNFAKAMAIAIIMLMAATGMRRAELVGLTWSYINFEKNFLTIKQTIIYRSGVEMYVSTPKTTKSKRKILLPEPLVRLLEEYKEEWQKAREIYGTLGNYEILPPDEDSIKHAQNGKTPKVKSFPSDFLFYKTENGK